MNKKTIIYIVLTVIIIFLILIFCGYPFFEEFNYIFLLFIRGIIIYDIINIVRKSEKGTSYIKFIISIITELLLIASGSTSDGDIGNLFTYIALLLIGIRFIISLIEFKKNFSYKNISYKGEPYMNKKKIYISITVTITILLFMIMFFLPETSLRGFFYSGLDILFLLLLEAIVFYDITKAVKNPDKIINYVNIIIFNIFVLFKIIDLVDEFVNFIMISISILRIISIIIGIAFKKIPVLKHNTKKIIIGTIATTVICLLIFTIIKSVIIIKIPYQTCHSNLWTSPNLKIIQNINELDKLFNEDLINDEVLEYHVNTEMVYNKPIKDLLKDNKENVIEKFDIDNDFFDKYYLVFVSEYSGNTASPIGIDYVTYNKTNNQVRFIQEDTRGTKIGGSPIVTYSSYFVKIEKKYLGDVSWETKYKPF